MQKTAAYIALSALFITVTAATAVTGKQINHVAAHEHPVELRDFVHGAPAVPTRAWILSAGGRLYDKWWAVLDEQKPSTVHPAYPVIGKRQNGDSWRCVECHGWDYLGRDGQSRAGDRYTGIRGVNAARGWDPRLIAEMLRSHPHNYTPEMIPDRELSWLALFISQGQHDARLIIDARTGKARGNVSRGREVFQSVCASCHGYDGKAINFGSSEKPSYVGTEARNAPYEALHRIRNSQPGSPMAGLRAFPLHDAVAVLAYAQTLPAK